MLRKIITICFTFLPALGGAADFASMAQRLTENYYVGIGMGWSYLKPQPDSDAPYVVSDSNGQTMRLHGGALLTDKYSVEASAARLGLAGIAGDSAPDITLTEIGYYVTAIGGVFRLWDYNNPYNVFAKIDATYLLTTNSNDAVPVENISTLSFGLGIGATYRLTPEWQVRADVETYARDIKTLAVGLEWSPAGTGNSGLFSDKDNDGVIDYTDLCPYSPPGSLVDFNGCEVENTSSNDGIDKCQATLSDSGVNNSKCEIQTGVTTQLETRPIQFASNSTELTKSSKKELDRLANYLIGNGQVLILVEAHTDSVGRKLNNQILSERRAETVRDYLVRWGIDSSRIETRGYGESQPIASNNNAKGRAKNRRVEFSLTTLN